MSQCATLCPERVPVDGPGFPPLVLTFCVIMGGFTLLDSRLHQVVLNFPMHIQFFHLSQATFATFNHHYYFLE